MHLKDHYRILELEPSATITEIKTAYRRLAQIYHPDKNNQDPYAIAQFHAIKEAYEVLSNPSRKAQYLQQRWYHQSTGSKKTAAIVTPVAVLRQSLELDKYITMLDVHRMDKQGLTDYITGMLSDDRLAELNRFDEPAIKREITGALLRSMQVLSYTQVFELSHRLKKLSPDLASIKDIELSLRQTARRQRWEKHMPWILLAVTTFLCLLIYLLNRH